MKEDAIKKAIEEAQSTRIKEDGKPTFIKGNKTDGLPDNSFFKDYEFENVQVGTRRGNKAPIMASDYYHLGITPCAVVRGVRTPISSGKNAQEPFRTLKSIREWKSEKDIYERNQTILWDILHDPTV